MQSLRLLIAVFVCNLLVSLAAVADDAGYLQRRIEFGINLFPNIVSVDTDIESKQSRSGELQLLIVYEHDEQVASDLAARLRSKVQSIKKLPVTVVIAKTTAGLETDKTAGIFIAEQLKAESFQAITDFAISRRALLFSPFAADVDRGVMVGFVIGSKILPSVNEQALEAAGIRLHPLFLKLAKRHEGS